MNNYEKNKEFFDENLFDLLSNKTWGVDKDTDKPKICTRGGCQKCKFCTNIYSYCADKRKEWLKSVDNPLSM